MSAYEELRDRCEGIVWTSYELSVEATVQMVLAEVFRTLETMTPVSLGYLDTAGEMNETWLALLRASPLAPGYAK